MLSSCTEKNSVIFELDWLGLRWTRATQRVIADGLGLIPRMVRGQAITILIFHGGDGSPALVSPDRD